MIAILRKKHFQTTLLLFFALFLPSSVAYAETPKKQTIAVTFSNTGKFDVLYDRAKSSATGAILGGLLGAGIEEGIRGGKDEKRVAQLRPHIDNPSCASLIKESLVKKFKKKDINLSFIDKNQDLPTDKPVLKINIKLCGFKLVNVQNENVSAFSKIKIKYLKHAKDKNPKTELLYITGKKSFAYENLLETPENINSEFEAVLKKSGRRIANKVIYL